MMVACSDAAQQAAFVAQRVTELREEGMNLDHIAVLYRSHFHALELQLELTRRQIPFSITSGIRYFEQAHLKDVIAWLKFVLNPRDELAFKRLVQLLPGIGPKGAEKLWQAFTTQYAKDITDRSEARAALRVGPAAPGGSAIATALQACAPAVPKKALIGWAQFATTVSQLEAKPVKGNASKMIQLVVEAGYEDYLKETHDNFRSRLDDLQQLAIFSGQFASLEDFLTQLALLTNLEAEEDRPARDDHERLRLSTIHQAKGLEFDAVFVIMLCDGLFPLNRVLESKNQEAEEEERRLFYVAITRARNELYFTYPLIRAGYGSSGDFMQRESRFLKEIPEELLETINLRQRW